MARKRTTTPNLPSDARAQRSAAALRAAFLELIEEKPLDRIAIREITDRAGVSYPTFFRRFAGKDELLKSIAAEEVRRLLVLGGDALHASEPEAAGEHLWRFIREHRRLWTVLLTSGAAPFVREEWRRRSVEFAESRPRINPWLPLELATAFTTSGIFELIAWWLRQPEDYPIGNVAKLFNALIVDPVGRRRAIRLEDAPTG